MSKINHHSFMRWSEEKRPSSKKEEKAGRLGFNPMELPEDSMERSMMLTAFSA
jgi:hypothetical protein